MIHFATLVHQPHWELPFAVLLDGGIIGMFQSEKQAHHSMVAAMTQDRGYERQWMRAYQRPG